MKAIWFQYQTENIHDETNCEIYSVFNASWKLISDKYLIYLFKFKNEFLDFLNLFMLLFTNFQVKILNLQIDFNKISLSSSC